EVWGISTASIEQPNGLQDAVTKSIISAHDTVAVKLDEDLFIFKLQPGQG
ncbi:4921_t:CDS:2, partial [Rhizophagus irregularis]